MPAPSASAAPPSDPALLLSAPPPLALRAAASPSPAACWPSGVGGVDEAGAEVWACSRWTVSRREARADWVADARWCSAASISVRCPSNCLQGIDGIHRPAWKPCRSVSKCDSRWREGRGHWQEGGGTAHCCRHPLPCLSMPCHKCVSDPSILFGYRCSICHLAAQACLLADLTSPSRRTICCTHLLAPPAAWQRPPLKLQCTGPCTVRLLMPSPAQHLSDTLT